MIWYHMSLPMSANEKIFPAPDTLNNLPYGKFVLTNLAAKRAKQIKDGAPPLVRIDSVHPLSIALAEIAAGKIKPILGADIQNAELEDDYSSMETVGLDDVGLLLPGVDDDDVSDADMELDLEDLDLDLSEEESDDDEDDDDEKGSKTSLADLIDDEDEISKTPEEEEGNISLDDLAEQEEGASKDDKENDV